MSSLFSYFLFENLEVLDVQSYAIYAAHMAPRRVEPGQERKVVKTIRLTESEVRLIERAAIKRMAKSGHLGTLSEYVRQAIYDALRRDGFKIEGPGRSRRN